MYRVEYSVTKKLLAASFIASCILTSTASYASEAIVTTLPGATAKLKVIMNQITLVKLDQKITDAMVGNPSIADITIQSNKSFIITGKSYGQTNIIMLNKEGKAIFNKSITVDDDRQNIVRVHHGMSRLSYTCSPNCQPTPTLGDDPIHVKTAMENIKGKMKTISNAMASSEN